MHSRHWSKYAFKFKRLTSGGRIKEISERGTDWRHGANIYRLDCNSS